MLEIIINCLRYSMDLNQVWLYIWLQFLHANRSNKDPHSTFDHSLRTLENSLDNSRGLVDHFIFLSSSMVYGNFKKNIVNENDRCEPLESMLPLNIQQKK